MATANDLTTLVCLFHHQDNAQAAWEELSRSGISQTSISRIDSHDSEESAGASLAQLGLPGKDQRHLLEGLQHGGIILVVAAIADHVDTVEEIFGKHQAAKIDEAARDQRDEFAAAPLAAAIPVAAEEATGERAIPIVAEELVIGKRTVDQGGVRVYRKVVEIPVEESVQLREEHVNIERRPVDRAVSAEDLAMQGEQVIELKETAEEVVIGKNARVVEEVLVGKEASERTEHIHDTVRHTEVEVEEVGPEGSLRTGDHRL